MSEKSTVSHTISKVLSVLFHPIFVPTLVMALVLWHFPGIYIGVSEKNRMWWVVIVAYITITFPLLVVFLLWRLKFIDTMYMHELKERYAPLIASMLFYFWVFWLFHKQLKAPELIQSFLFGTFLTTAGVFLASIFYKISMHTSAWASVATYALILCFQGIEGSVLFFVVAIFIVGLIGSIRLYIKAHSPFEVFSGYAVGALAQLIAFFIIHRYVV